MKNLHFRGFPLAHVRLRFAHELQKPYPHLSALCLCKMGDPPRIFPACTFAHLLLAGGQGV
jgi:hypothetical protein